MTQLSYHEALDPYHTAFRMLRLRGALGETKSYPVDQIRICDYYLVFPTRAATIRFRREHSSFKKISQEYAARKPYGQPPNDLTFLGRMQPIQISALASLAREKLLDLDLYLAGQIKFLQRELPSELAERLFAINKRDQRLVEFVVALANEYVLTGKDGLKDRTGLLEHRYDAA